jgi:hypothetical protein
VPKCVLKPKNLFADLDANKYRQIFCRSLHRHEFSTISCLLVSFSSNTCCLVKDVRSKAWILYSRPTTARLSLRNASLASCRSAIIHFFDIPHRISDIQPLWSRQKSICRTRTSKHLCSDCNNTHTQLFTPTGAFLLSGLEILQFVRGQ